MDECPDHNMDDYEEQQFLALFEGQSYWTFLPYGGSDREQKSMVESECWEDDGMEKGDP